MHKVTTPVLNGAHKSIWTAAEDDFIRKYYPTGGVREVCKYIPGRTVAAILRRASVLQVARNTDQPTPGGSLAVGSDDAVQKRLNAARIASLIGLPWVTYPKDPDSIEVAAQLLESLIARAPIESVGAYLRTEAASLRARAERMRLSASSESPTLHTMHSRAVRVADHAA